MNKNRSYTDRIFSIGRQGDIRTETLGTGGIWHGGSVATASGYVMVDSRHLVNGYKLTNLEIIHNGEVYVRHFDEYFRPQTLVRLANQFAWDVVADRVSDGDRT